MQSGKLLSHLYFSFHAMKVSNYLFLISLLISPIAFNQIQTLNEFNSKRVQYVEKGMLTLGAWSFANIASGTIGYLSSSGEARYFHQMNAGWNIVNAVIAGTGYFQNKKRVNPSSLSESILEQRKVEQAYLFNTALNFTYISTGLLLKSQAQHTTDNFHRFQGYGNSLILQGGFLFLFDLSSYLIHKANRNKRLNPLLEKIEIADQGIGVKIKL